MSLDIGKELLACIDQEKVKALGMKLVGEQVKPFLDGLKAKIASHEIDPIKGIEADNLALVALVDGLEKALGL